jgi:uncharacterized protein YciI
MLFALICNDRPGALAVRLETRPAHLAYLEKAGVAMAGPFLDDSGQPCGSLVIIDVEDRAAAEAWAAGDPYSEAGLFASVEIRAWRKAIG